MHFSSIKIIAVIETEILLCSTEKKLRTVTVNDLTLGQSKINISVKAKNLGVYIDCSLTMESQINNLCKTLHYELRRLGQIRQYLTVDATKTLVCSLIFLIKTRLLQLASLWSCNNQSNQTPKNSKPSCSPCPEKIKLRRLYRATKGTALASSARSY